MSPRVSLSLMKSFADHHHRNQQHPISSVWCSGDSPLSLTAWVAERRETGGWGRKGPVTHSPHKRVTIYNPRPD